MATLAALFTLAKSLSKPEKRYFQLFAGLQSGEKQYLKLYRLLDEAESMEEIEENICHHFGENTPDMARKHLYKMLMKSLRNYEAEHSVEAQLLNLIGDIQILYKKGLLDLCLDQIEKAKRMALQYEKFSLFLAVARLELQYLTRFDFVNLAEEDLVARQQAVGAVLEQELLMHRHASLCEVLLHRYLHRGVTRGPQEVAGLNDLLLEEHALVARRPKYSFESNKLHLHFQSTYFLMTGQHEASLGVFYELNALFEENESLWRDSPLYYVYLLNGILTDLRAIGKYDNIGFFLDRLLGISPSSGTLGSYIQYSLYQHRLAALIDVGKFADALDLVQAYEKEGLRKLTVSFAVRATLYFQTAQVFFGMAQYHPALQYISAVLNAREHYGSHPLYVQCRLLHLLIHLELGNTDYLSYEVRSVERKLKAEKKLYEVEKAVLELLRQLIRKRPPKGIYKKFMSRFAGIVQDPVGRQTLRVLHLVPWLKAKAESKPFPEAVREEYEKNSPGHRSIASS